MWTYIGTATECSFLLAVEIQIPVYLVSEEKIHLISYYL